MAFICGSFRSKGQEDNHDVLCPFSSTNPRKPTRRRRFFGIRSNKNTTNPYSDCGLDKFEALLADLDQKRHKILTEIGSDQDVSMVKFIYKGPYEMEPIVIKLRDQRKHHNASTFSSPEYLDHQLKDASFIKSINNGGNEAKEDNKKPLVDECKRKIGEWLKPCYYFPLFVILILVLLIVFGRSFAILCTSIGWYMVPIFNETLLDSKQANNITKKSG